MPPHRRERVEEAIHEALAEVFLFTFQDPRMPQVFNITAVKVTPDLQQARVYFTQMPEDPKAIDETLRVLERAKGFLRSQVADEVQLRYTPELKFFYDEGARKAERIENLLRQAKPPGGWNQDQPPPLPDDDRKDS